VSHTWWHTLRGQRTTPGGATLKVSLEGQPSQVSSLGTSSRCQLPGVATPPGTNSPRPYAQAQVVNSGTDFSTDRTWRVRVVSSRMIHLQTTEVLCACRVEHSSHTSSFPHCGVREGTATPHSALAAASPSFSPYGTCTTPSGAGVVGEKCEGEAGRRGESVKGTA
jgi:hypothetical protein